MSLTKIRKFNVLPKLEEDAFADFNNEQYASAILKYQRIIQLYRKLDAQENAEKIAGFEFNIGLCYCKILSEFEMPTASTKAACYQSALKHLVCAKNLFKNSHSKAKCLELLSQLILSDPDDVTRDCQQLSVKEIEIAKVLGADKSITTARELDRTATSKAKKEEGVKSVDNVKASDKQGKRCRA